MPADLAAAHTHFTEPTTHYWQTILPPSSSPPHPPFHNFYPATLPDSRVLRLPIRQLKSNPDHAVASLLVNQASMAVVRELGKFLAEKVKEMEVEVVIGLPTLGLALAPIVAEELGLANQPLLPTIAARYIPCGYSRKFWYTDDLSTTISSITSPTPKKIYLDPNLLPLLHGKRCLLVDDAVSSGTTIQATWTMLERAGVDIVGCGVAMVQGDRWRELMEDKRASKTVGVFDSPLLEKVEGGWGYRT
ncbi:hypothetical protein MNV49_007849 [Pseudohyphozyma bogoriensis]|nr:hypothetical protein MNV49_007849 [Pseudohyphozyma bogoriensis]